MTNNIAALQSIVRLQRIDVARQHEATATARANWAGLESEYWTLRRQIAEWESRTGLDHGKLLAAKDYHNPMGDQ